MAEVTVATVWSGISGRLIGGFVAVFALVAFVGWHQLRDIDDIHDRAGFIEHANQQSHRLHDMEVRIRNMVAHAHDYLITGSEEWAARYRRDGEAIRGMINGMSLEAALKLDIERSLRNMNNIAERLFSLPFATGNMEGPILMQELDNELAIVAARMSEHHHRMDEEVDASMRMVSGLHLDMREDFLASLAVLFALLSALAIYLYLRVARPLARLRAGVSRIGAGDFSPQCPDFGDNEIGELSRAINRMGEALRERDEALVQAKSFAAHQEKMHALGLMAAGIAHEVGNPLSAATVSVEVGLRKLARQDHEAAIRHLHDALSELRRTEGIVRNVLDFGRQTDADAGVIRLDRVIDSALRLARMSRDARQVRFRVRSAAGLPRIPGNEDVVRQVLVNLLLNAVDASGPGDEIHIETGRDVSGCFVDVVDQGEGVLESMRAQIFSPLFTTKPRGKGNGLGLSISRDLMRRMGGELRLVEAGERGCRFRILLPLGKAPC